ncbi:hypothetical protein NEOC84_001636|nr:hypothetical protein [Neochlamydia sp. AcF84]
MPAEIGQISKLQKLHLSGNLPTILPIISCVGTDPLIPPKRGGRLSQEADKSWIKKK